MELEKTSRRILLSARLRSFPERLRRAMDGKSIRGFARECGLSEGVMRSYLRGDTYPSLDRLETIALAAGVNDCWLATGEGRMGVLEVRESKDPYRPMNEKLIGDIIEQVELHLRQNGRELPPAKKRELILVVYDLSLAEGNIDFGAIDRLVNLAT
jgi:transcriptional regulator with XRE-family HTH domain